MHAVAASGGAVREPLRLSDRGPSACADPRPACSRVMAARRRALWRAAAVRP